jgi:hypothetical protein
MTKMTKKKRKISTVQTNGNWIEETNVQERMKDSRQSATELQKQSA